MNEIERPIAIEEIKKLKGKYFLGLDTKDWELATGVFDRVADRGWKLR